MNKSKTVRTIFVLPLIIYTLLLILIPLIYIFIISFFKSDSYGGMIETITLMNYMELFDLVYVKVFLKSFLVAIITTIVCILISYPFVLSVCHKSKITQKIIMISVMLPFLTNSLIRMYGWIVLLRKSGIINETLLSLNIIKEPLSLMYNTPSIIVGMVYTLLPFMLLPLYSSISSLDKYQIEASYDLGANKFKSFKNIIFPQSIPGLFNGALMVFTPAVGYFFIVDILGGGKIMILGNLIKNQFLTARNWPFGAAISIFLIFITFVIVMIYKRLGGKLDDLGGA